MKLRYTAHHDPYDIAEPIQRLAVLLDCLHLTTRGDDGQCHLPRPIQAEFREIA